MESIDVAESDDPVHMAFVESGIVVQVIGKKRNWNQVVKLEAVALFHMRAAQLVEHINTTQQSDPALPDAALLSPQAKGYIEQFLLKHELPVLKAEPKGANLFEYPQGKEPDLAEALAFVERFDF